MSAATANPSAAPPPLPASFQLADNTIGSQNAVYGPPTSVDQLVGTLQIGDVVALPTPPTRLSTAALNTTSRSSRSRYRHHVRHGGKAGETIKVVHNAKLHWVILLDSWPGPDYRAEKGTRSTTEVEFFSTGTFSATGRNLNAVIDSHRVGDLLVPLPLHPDSVAPSPVTAAGQISDLLRWSSSAPPRATSISLGISRGFWPRFGAKSTSTRPRFGAHFCVLPSNHG
jgi:hypothetical protein